MVADGGPGNGKGGTAGEGGFRNLGFVPLATGGNLATLSLEKVSASIVSRDAEYRLRVCAAGCAMEMDNDGELGNGTQDGTTSTPRRFPSASKVMDVRPSLFAPPKEPGSPRRSLRHPLRPNVLARGLLGSSGIFRSPLQIPRQQTRLADAIRLAVHYDMQPTEATQEIKSALLEFGDTTLVWDTASSHKLFSHLYRTLASAFLPVAPFGRMRREATRSTSRTTGTPASPLRR